MTTRTFLRPNLISAVLITMMALLVQLLPGAVRAAETFEAAIDIEEIYLARMGDTASTRTLNLIAKLGEEESGWVAMGNGVYYYDLAEGRGKRPVPGDLLRIHLRICHRDGKTLTDTIAFREPQHYLPGGGIMPLGFERAITTIRVGGRRLIALTESENMDFETVVFPYHRGRPKAGDQLIYEITLLDSRPDELRSTIRFQ